MAFARSWNEAQPDGSENASDIDLEIRNLKVDIRERLEDITSFGTDADPMELDASAVADAAPTFYGAYDDSQAAGNKVTAEGRGKLLAVNVSATTDSNGIVSIDLSEFSEPFDLTDNNTTAVATSFSGVSEIATITAWATASDTVSVQLFDDTGATINNSAVQFIVFILVH